MEDIKYAIFDVDGTLMDSMHIWDTIGGAYLMMNGIVPEEKNLFRSLGFEKGIAYAIEHYSLDATPDEIKADVYKILEYYYFRVPKAKKGIKEVLERFKAKGVKMAVATATDRYLIENALERNGLLEYFDAFFTTREVGKSKLTPDIYDLAKEAIGGDETTVVFEDACYAIETAVDAGYRVVAVEDYSAADEVDRIKEIADYYITDYKEIFNIFNV